MTAFLFIPTTVGGIDARRVDFANVASLFAEVEEPAHRSDAGRKVLRAVAAALLLVLVIGDTLLVTRPGADAGLPAARAASTRAMF